MRGESALAAVALVLACAFGSPACGARASLEITTSSGGAIGGAASATTYVSATTTVGATTTHASATTTASTATTGGNGPPPLTVFVTSDAYPPSLGGLAGADSICQKEAVAAGLPGVFQAWLADSEGTPASRFVHANRPYQRVDGVRIANDWADLTSGSIAVPIDLTATGAKSSGDTSVWTDVAPNGTEMPADPIYGPLTCHDWTYSGTQGLGNVGELDAGGAGAGAGAYWTTEVDHQCTFTSHLYCFEQP